MTAGDLQENRRVCKFPCTSRGEGLSPAGSCVGQGQAAGRRPVYSPYKAQEAGRRPPLLRSGGRPCGAPCPGEARAACGRPASCTYFPKRSSPGSPRPCPRQAAAWGRGKRRVGVPFTARARRRKPAAGPRCAAAGGAPQGRPARAKPGRPAAVFSPCIGRPKGEKPYPLAPSSSGCSCSPRRAASSAAPVSESSAQRLVGFFRGSSCPKGTK